MIDKKITIEMLGKTLGEKNEKKQGVFFPMIDVKIEGFESDPNYSVVVGVLLQAYLQESKKFLKTHTCKDCPAYEANRKIYTAVHAIEMEVKNKYFGT